MAIKSVGLPTLADIAKTQMPGGMAADIVELLAKQNAVLDDIGWQTCNDGRSHLITVRTGLPKPVWVRLNTGIRPTKSTSAQAVFTCGRMEDMSMVDCREVDRQPQPAAYRLSEDVASMEAMRQEMATRIFYGDEATLPESFTGLAHYYSSADSETADNIIDAEGTGNDLRSIWLVTWHEMATMMLLPRGVPSGLQTADAGKQLIQNLSVVGGGADDGYAWYYVTNFAWEAGLAVKDWRYNARIANIDVSALKSDASSGADLTDLLIDLVWQARNARKPINARSAIYCNSDIMRMLMKQEQKAVKNSTLSVAQMYGRDTLTIKGVPVRECEALDTAESQITGL